MIKRPIQTALIELFKQNQQLHISISEATKLLHKKRGELVGDNMFILTELGYLTFDSKRQRTHKFGTCNGRFSLAPNYESVDLTNRTQAIKKEGHKFAILHFSKNHKIRRHRTPNPQWSEELRKLYHLKPEDALIPMTKQEYEFIKNLKKGSLNYPWISYDKLPEQTIVTKIDRPIELAWGGLVR